MLLSGVDREIHNDRGVEGFDRSVGNVFRRSKCDPVSAGLQGLWSQFWHAAIIIRDGLGNLRIIVAQQRNGHAGSWCTERSIEYVSGDKAHENSLFKRRVAI